MNSYQPVAEKYIKNFFQFFPTNDFFSPYKTLNFHQPDKLMHP